MGPPTPSIRMFPRDSFRRLVSLFRFSHDVDKISLNSHARRRLPCWAYKFTIGCVNALASVSQMNQFLLLQVHINLGAGESEVSSPRGLRLDDLAWHDVRIERENADLQLTIDGIYKNR